MGRDSVGSRGSRVGGARPTGTPRRQSYSGRGPPQLQREFTEPAVDNSLRDDSRAVTVGDLLQKLLRKEIVSWIFLNHRDEFSLEVIDDSLEHILKPLARNMVDAANVWIPDIELTSESLLPDLDLQPSVDSVERATLPLMLKKLIFDSIQVLACNIPLTEMVPSAKPLPAEAAFNIASALALTAEHLMQVRLDLETAVTDIAPNAEDTPLRTELTIPEAIQQGDIFLEEYQARRKKLVLIDRDMQIRARCEKEKVLLEKMDRQQAEKRLMGTSEQLLVKTSERTSELKKFEADLAECQRARKYAELVLIDKQQVLEESRVALDRMRAQMEELAEREKMTSCGLLHLAEREHKLLVTALDTEQINKVDSDGTTSERSRVAEQLGSLQVDETNAISK